MKIFGWEFGRKRAPEPEPVAPVVAIDDLNPSAYAGQQRFSPWETSIYDGSKFAGGFGPTQLFQMDYWTLRARSSQLFHENLYARGLIRRLVTNEINTGLTPEAYPDASIVGETEDALDVWTEDVETRFGLWAKSPRVCDWKREQTFGALQRVARAESLIAGDVLVVLRQSRSTKVPQVQLIRGDVVRTPLAGQSGLHNGHKIRHGVEFDTRERAVAYWIQQPDMTFKRLPAVGEKSGRRIAWLVFGTDKRLDGVRGVPMLSLVMQSLKEIDRYRDSAQRKAVVNSILAMFIKKTEDKMGTLPVTGAAVRRDAVAAVDNDGKPRQFNIAAQIPGVVMEELQTGEEPVGFHSQGTDTDFQKFEEAIISAVAWAYEVPPEILKLAFSNNYSASQAAINEFKIYLNLIWSAFGEDLCQPIYTAWLLSETLNQKVAAPGFLEAWRDPAQYEILASWASADWYGSIKPSTDMLKQAKGSQLLVREGWSTNAREARVTTGTKFVRNAKRLARENQLKADALRPMLELQQEFGTTGEESDTGGVPSGDTSPEATADAVVDAIAENQH